MSSQTSSSPIVGPAGQTTMATLVPASKSVVTFMSNILITLLSFAVAVGGNASAFVLSLLFASFATAPAAVKKEPDVDLLTTPTTANVDEDDDEDSFERSSAPQTPTMSVSSFGPTPDIFSPVAKDDMEMSFFPDAASISLDAKNDGLAYVTVQAFQELESPVVSPVALSPPTFDVADLIRESDYEEVYATPLLSLDGIDMQALIKIASDKQRGLPTLPVPTPLSKRAKKKAKAELRSLSSSPELKAYTPAIPLIPLAPLAPSSKPTSVPVSSSQSRFLTETRIRKFKKAYKAQTGQNLNGVEARTAMIEQGFEAVKAMVGEGF